MRRLGWFFAGVVALLAGAFALLYTPDIPASELRQRYANAESEFLEIAPGLTVHLRDEGPAEAPVLVLLHGSNASLHTWEPWVARLSADHRVISLDLPGHGLTGASPTRDYSAAANVAAVDAVVRAKGVSRFTLAGNSMGGGIAWRYALAHPDKLEGLILVDAAGAPPKGKTDLPIGFRLARMPVVRDVMTVVTPRSMIERSLKQSVSVQSIVTPAAIDRYWELLRHPGNRQATVDRFGMTRDPVTKATFAAIRVPTLIIWGAEDKLIPVDNARWLAAAIPGSRTVIYPSIGHIPMEETPDRSAADVRAFLASRRAPPSSS
jgi:pimeloyl-ACP methyl ester carboxylesterase